LKLNKRRGVVLNETQAKVVRELEKQIGKRLEEWKHYKICGGKIWWLDLSGTKIRDLSPLSKLTDLEYLDLSLTDVNDLTPLSSLNNLKTLDLEGCWRIKDISPLAKLKKLESLNIGGTRVNDLAPLQSLENLREVKLSCCPRLKDASPLIELRRKYGKLEKVRLGGIMSLSGVYSFGMMSSLISLVLTDQVLSRNVSKILSDTILYRIYLISFLYAFLLFGLLIPTLYYYPINSLSGRLGILLFAFFMYPLVYMATLAHLFGLSVFSCLKSILGYSLFMTLSSVAFGASFLAFPSDKIPKNQILELQRLGVYAERVVSFGAGTVMGYEYELILRYCGKNHDDIYFRGTTRIRSLEIVSFAHFPLMFIASILFPLGGVMEPVAISIFWIAMFLLFVLLSYILGYGPVNVPVLVLLSAIYGGAIFFMYRFVSLIPPKFFIIQVVVWIPTIVLFANRLGREFYHFPMSLVITLDLGGPLALSLFSCITALVFLEKCTLYIFPALIYLILGIVLYDRFDKNTW